ncbi:MAG: hypothetical protein IJS88_06240 [Alphaproteobacteria bacterium]|nr:hypothetical protein [Alphaproteobacteria bacterium]
MADTTNQEFIEKIAALPNPQEDIKVYDTSVITLLNELNNRTNLDGLDTATLDKFIELLDGRDLPENLRSLPEKIINRREELLAQQPQPKTEETIISLQEQPQEKEPNNAPYDALTSRNLLNIYNKIRAEYNRLAVIGQQTFGQNPPLQDSPEAKQLAQKMASFRQEMLDIEKYINKELEETELSSHNAPTIKDYVEILTASDENYKYPNQDSLTKALEDYDKDNGLDGEFSNQAQIAEQLLKNEQKWTGIVKENVIPSGFEEDASLHFLKDTDKETYKEILDTLRAITITELAAVVPCEDEKENTKLFLEKYNETAAQYLGSVSTTIKLIEKDEEQKAKWWKGYCEANNIPLDKIGEISQNPQHIDAFNKYMFSNIYKTMNGIYTERNAIYASRLSQKTGMNRVLNTASHQKLALWQKHPEIMTAVKNGGKSAALSVGMVAALGPIGLTAKQGWQLVGAFKKSYNNYAAQNEGQKKSIGGFFKYLNNNKEEGIGLLKQTATFAVSAGAVAALYASGALAFGAIGSLSGFGMTNAVASATQAAAIKLMKMKVTGIITAVAGGATYVVVQQKISPKKKELMEILQKNLQGQQVENKGLLSFFKTKDPAKRAYQDLTRLFNSDEKLMEKIASLNLPAQDKERVMELAKEIKQLKAARGAAVAGTIIGGGMANGEEVKDFIGNLLGDGDKTDTLAENTTVGNAASEQPQLTDTQQADVIAEEPQTHTFEITDNRVVTQPNATYVILKEMGLMNGKDFDELRGGNTHITQSQMTAYLNKLQLTDTQQQEFQAKLDNGEFDKIKDDLNNHRMVIYAGGEIANGHETINSGSGNTGENVGNTATAKTGNAEVNSAQASAKSDGNANDGVAVVDKEKSSDAVHVEKAAEAEKKIGTVTGKAEEGSWWKRMWHKKHDYDVNMVVTGETDKDVENYAARIAMQSRGLPINSESNEAIKQDGYTVKGKMTDIDGTSHKFKVNVESKNGYTVTTRTIDDVRTKIYKTEDNNRVELFKGKKEEASFVGDANGTKADVVLGSQRNDAGVQVTYIQDGDTKKVYSISNAGENAGKAVDTGLSAKKITSILKNMGKGRI